MNKIYMDNAATTPVRNEVLEAMIPYYGELYGNPSSLYQTASLSKRAVEHARAQVADALGAKPDEIYFTGGGTESDNWALIGAADGCGKEGGHIITTSIEHHAVLHTCRYLEEKGFDITYLPVDAEGLVTVRELEQAIRPDTFLISVMFANNEIGTIQPIKEIGRLAKERNILFHTDAVQAVGHIPIDVNVLNIDLLSLSAHKIYGPKGVGVLYVRKGTKLKSFIHGGAQERGRRAGTENVPGIVGMGHAIELVSAEMREENKRLIPLRDRLIEEILTAVPNARLNGHRTERLPGNVNISFEFVEGESILLLLDTKGIAASSGSACTSGSLDPSHVLLAIGLPHENAHGSIRLTLGRHNTESEVNEVIRELPPIIERLRGMSPLYEDFISTQR
ncbi:MAG: cysteine desulfurase NifS [Oscillospiraceae bacterium]|jgi:cysteine desulfurase|nr:cysteine desulfurase NifS [Oscillospiraceae bacterium]